MVGKITGEIRGYTAAVLVSDSNVTHWPMLCKTEARQVAKGNTKKRIALVQLQKMPAPWCLYPLILPKAGQNKDQHHSFFNENVINCNVN